MTEVSKYISCTVEPLIIGIVIGILEQNDTLDGTLDGRVIGIVDENGALDGRHGGRLIGIVDENHIMVDLTVDITVYLKNTRHPVILVINMNHGYQRTQRIQWFQ